MPVIGPATNTLTLSFAPGPSMESSAAPSPSIVLPVTRWVSSRLPKVTGTSSPRALVAMIVTLSSQVLPESTS